MKARLIALAVFLFLLPLAAQAEFGFHAGSHFGFGKMENVSRTITRDIGTFDLQFMPGYRIAGFMPGLMIDYRLMSQLQDSAVEEADFSGTGLLLGLGVTFEPGPVKILVSYDLRSRHWHSGPDTTYAGSGYHLLLGYKFFPGLAFDLQYVSSTYNSVEAGGIANGLPEDTMKHWNLGFGISYSY